MKNKRAMTLYREYLKGKGYDVAKISDETIEEIRQFLTNIHKKAIFASLDKIASELTLPRLEENNNE